MSFTDHLTELRSALIKVIIILLVSFVICYSFSGEIAEILLRPLRENLGTEGRIIFTGVLDKVLAYFRLSFWSSVILSSPFWFYIVWGFIKPGLYEKEIKVIRPFFLVSFILFILGVLFGYFILFPFTFETLMKFGETEMSIGAYIDIKDYLILSCKVLVFLGLLFQLPVLMLILGFMGVATKQSLSAMRPYVLTGFAVISAAVTPPDPITLLCVWVPLVLLYQIGIWAVALIVHPYLRRQHLD